MYLVELEATLHLIFILIKCSDSLMLLLNFLSSTRSRETGRSMRWSWRRRRRKRCQPSSEVGVPAAPPTPSLTHVATPTSFRRDGAFDDARRPVAEHRTASGRFPRERQRTCDGGCVGDGAKQKLQGMKSGCESARSARFVFFLPLRSRC